MITGMTEVLGVIGDPISHTLSPFIHRGFIGEGDLVYVPFHVDSQKVGGAMEALRALNIRGINVTIPHKNSVIEFLDNVDIEASQCGSVNTIVNRDGVLTGYTTDGFGFLKSLGDFDLKNKEVLIFGAGGSCKAICHALHDSGVKCITLVARHENPEITNVSYSKVPVDADLIINTTPVGMKSDQSIIEDFSIFRKSALVYDLIYTPRITRFLQKAEECGLKTINGLDMLIYQAQKSFELFTGKTVDPTVVDNLRKQLKMEKNVVLTGFMGTGKTTIGKELARILCVPFVDIDQVITSQYGHIPAIFKEKGEEYFRDIEEKIILQYKNKKGFVIALGGGTVLRKNNILALRENSHIVRLNANFSFIYQNIVNSDRPLAHAQSPDYLREILKYREKFYEDCDVTIDSLDNPINNILCFLSSAM